MDRWPSKLPINGQSCRRIEVLAGPERRRRWSWEEKARIEVVVAPEATTCPCCQGAMHVIGEDRSGRLDIIPARHQVIVTIRPKYGCRACASTVVQARAPARLRNCRCP